MEKNKKTYTTGEIAQLCNISVRTVQFYDKEGIIKPSDLSDGGRRIYSESELEKFKLVFLYKNLGFSLKEIKDIIGSGEEYTIILDLMHTKELKIEDQIQSMIVVKEKLAILQKEFKNHGMATISSEDELGDLLFKKEKHSKIGIRTYIFIACYTMILILGFSLAIKVGVFYIYAMVVISVVLLLALIYYHSSVNAYLCPNCCKKFVVGFFRDMFSLNGGKRGKYLKCPYCNHRAWMNETFKDE